jgi:DNA-directed RNA polymerase subunit beta
MIAQANTPLDESRPIAEKSVPLSGGHRLPVVPDEQVTYMDVSPKQVVSVGDGAHPVPGARRATGRDGANMQRRQCPCFSRRHRDRPPASEYQRRGIGPGGGFAPRRDRHGRHRKQSTSSM